MLNISNKQPKHLAEKRHHNPEDYACVKASTLSYETQNIAEFTMKPAL